MAVRELVGYGHRSVIAKAVAIDFQLAIGVDRTDRTCSPIQARSCRWDGTGGEETSSA